MTTPQPTVAVVAQEEDKLPKAGTSFPTVVILMSGLLIFLLSVFADLSG